METRETFQQRQDREGREHTARKEEFDREWKAQHEKAQLFESIFWPVFIGIFILAFCGIAYCWYLVLTGKPKSFVRYYDVTHHKGKDEK